MPTPAKSAADFQPGDYYEDCSYHPCLCIRVMGDGDDELLGISLVDGSYPRGCSIRHCGVRKLTFAEAVHWRLYGPADHTLPDDQRWWTMTPKSGSNYFTSETGNA